MTTSISISSGEEKKGNFVLGEVIFFLSFFYFFGFEIFWIWREIGENWRGVGKEGKSDEQINRRRLTFNFRHFFVQHMDWPFFQRTVAVIVVLLHKASRHFFDQHLDKFFFTVIFTLFRN